MSATVMYASFNSESPYGVRFHAERRLSHTGDVLSIRVHRLESMARGYRVVLSPSWGELVRGKRWPTKDSREPVQPELAMKDQFLPTENARELLDELGRNDLAQLMKFSRYRVGVEVGAWDIDMTTLQVLSPRLFSHALDGLPQLDKNRIAEALSGDLEGLDIQFVDGDSLRFLEDREANVEPIDALFAEVICQRNTLVDVATGGTPINEVNDHYKARRNRIIKTLRLIEFEDPNPHPDLWEWYRFYSGKFESYRERREYISNLYRPLIRRLAGKSPTVAAAFLPTGWGRVDRAIAKAESSLDHGRREEDFQTVGLLCREILISVGQAVYDATLHASPDGVMPSRTDASRMLGAAIATMLPGKSNEAMRRFAKASIGLALVLQHRRSASKRHALLCIEATKTTARILRVLTDDPETRLSLESEST